MEKKDQKVEGASSDTQGLHELTWELLMKNDMISVIEKVKNLQKTSSQVAQVAVEFYQKFRDSYNATSTENWQFALYLLQEMEIRQKNCDNEMQLHMDQLQWIEKKNRVFLSFFFMSIQKRYEQSCLDRLDNLKKWKKLSVEIKKVMGERKDRNDEIRKRVQENGRKMIEMLQQLEQMKKENDSILKLIDNDRGDRGDRGDH